MKEAEIPLDFSFVFELAELPSLEDVLHLEKEIRSIKASDDIECIKKDVYHVHLYKIQIEC